MKELQRKFLQDGGVERMIAARPELEIVPLEEREAMRRRVLAEFDTGHDVWIFAYGSLMWNPAFRYAEKRVARVHGYHRAFCHHSRVARGTAEYPGLMAGLDRGGSCRGLAYRIARAELECETRILWNRETALPIYKPRVLTISSGRGPLRAIAFVANRASEHYVGRVPLEEQVDRIGRAAGELGSNAEYLFRLVDSLAALGLGDRPIERLRRRVAAKIGE
jgi:glutathione-specific gamma-glutamylcyclotransferase